MEASRRLALGQGWHNNHVEHHRTRFSPIPPDTFHCTAWCRGEFHLSSPFDNLYYTRSQRRGQKPSTMEIGLRVIKQAGVAGNQSEIFLCLFLLQKRPRVTWHG